MKRKGNHESKKAKYENEDVGMRSGCTCVQPLLYFSDSAEIEMAFIKIALNFTSSVEVI